MRTGPAADFLAEEALRACVPAFFLATREPWQAADDLSARARRLGMGVCVYNPGEGLKRARKAWEALDPLEVLDRILQEHVRNPGGGEPVLWVLQMFHRYLQDPDPLLLSRLKTLHDRLRFSASVAVLVEPGFRPPAELRDLPFLADRLPGQEYFLGLVDSDMESYSAAEKTAIARALCGFTRREAEDLLSLSIARTGRMDPALIRQVRARVIRRQGEGLLEFPETDTCLEDVGGLEDLVSWLEQRRRAFLDPGALLDHRLPPPRGVFLMGVPGCGKSLVARALAGSWDVPLVKLDAGRLFSSEVGGSEARLFRALDTARALAPCVLLLDEMEKGFSPVSGFSDGGTALRVQAALLDFLQERVEAVFVVATSNGPGALAPEVMRRGRWDEIFFLDLPSEEERRRIFEVLFRRYRLELSVEPELVRRSRGFSGAEMEQAVRDTLYEERVFANRPVGSLALVRRLRDLVRLSRMRGGEIQALREWALRRARPAHAPPCPPAGTAGLRSLPVPGREAPDRPP